MFNVSDEQESNSAKKQRGSSRRKYKKKVKSEGEDIDDIVCQICNSGDDEENILLCDDCNKGMVLNFMLMILYIWFCYC